jgi:hypothetical protein
VDHEFIKHNKRSESPSSFFTPWYTLADRALGRFFVCILDGITTTGAISTLLCYHAADYVRRPVLLGVPV